MLVTGRSSSGSRSAIRTIRPLASAYAIESGIFVLRIQNVWTSSRGNRNSMP